MRSLTPKQRRFVAEYLIDLNATQAAIRAGYSKKNADQIGPRLVGKSRVAAALAERQARQLEKSELTAAVTNEAIRRHVAADAYGDIRRLFDERGHLRPMTSLSAEDATLIASCEVISKNAAAGTHTVHKVKLRDLSTYVEMAAKHFALLTDVARLDRDKELLDRLDRGRQRNAQAKQHLESGP